MWIDTKLSFVIHTTRQKEKIKKVFGKIKRINKQTRALGRFSLRLLYKNVFLPILLYGVEAWGYRIEHTHVKRQINAAQRFVILSMYNFCKTTSTEAMQVITGLLPADLQATLNVANYEIKKNKPVQCLCIPPPENERDKEEIRRLRNMAERYMYAKWQERWESTDKD